MDHQVAANESCHRRHQSGQSYSRIKAGLRSRQEHRDALSRGQPAPPTSSGAQVWQGPEDSRIIHLRSGNTKVQANTNSSNLAEEVSRMSCADALRESIGEVARSQ